MAHKTSGKVYDLVVLGAGSGGLEAAYNSAVTYNAKVAVIEPQVYHGPPLYSALGGTCVNVGCIPKKLMYYASEKATNVEVLKSFGWKFHGEPYIEWRELMHKKDTLLREINDSYLEMFRDTKNLELISGWGRIGSDKHSVEVYEQVPEAQSPSQNIVTVLQAKNILVCTGSWPFKPAIPGIEHAITSNEFFYLQEKPKRVVIVGGGYIAMEFLSILHGLGVEHIHLVYRGDLPLKGFDSTLRVELLRQLKNKKNISLHLNENIKQIALQDDGFKHVVLENSDAIDNADTVIFCTGRNPRSENLGLEGVSVNITPGSGSIIVDECSRTNVDGIWAVGDVTDRIALTPVAIAEGRCVADSIFSGKPQKVDYACVPKAVFSTPPIASVGITEDYAVENKLSVEIYLTQFNPLRFSGCSDDKKQKAVFKLVVDSDTKIVLGAHILEPSAPEVIQTVAVALKMKAKIADFYNTIGLHPSSAEELCCLRTPSYRIVEGSRLEEK